MLATQPPDVHLRPLGRTIGTTMQTMQVAIFGMNRTTALTGGTATNVTIDTTANSVAIGINGVFVNGLITVATLLNESFGPTLIFHPTVDFDNSLTKVRNRETRHNPTLFWL
jgi:hypothetical protein